MIEQEGYSREAFDKAEADIEAAKVNISPDKSTEALRVAVDQKGTAESEKDRLHEIAWDEALELNRRYDELWEQKEAAEQAIADFRRDNTVLQMSGEAKVEGEKKEKTLEEQVAIYAEMFDVDAGKVLEMAQAKLAEMSKEEQKAFTMLVFSPEGKTTVKAWGDVKKQTPVYEGINPRKITTEGETEEAMVFFARYDQEPDEDTLGKNAQSALDREATDKKWMSPKQRMIVGEFYRRAEGKQLDEKNWTQCPGSRADGRVPRLGFDSGYGKVYLNSNSPEYRNPLLGARQVV